MLGATSLVMVIIYGPRLGEVRAITYHPSRRDSIGTLCASLRWGGTTRDFLPLRGSTTSLLCCSSDPSEALGD